MSQKVLQFTLSPACDDEVVMLLPFIENLEEAGIDDWDYETEEEALELLNTKWSDKSRWDYSERTTFTLKLIDAYTEREAEEIGRQLELFIREKAIELPMLPTSDKTAKCEEFEIVCFKENMWTQEMWSRPFDNIPEDCHFSCYYAYDCHIGRIYSKDFAYFDCECCGRTICEQNPSNGWMTQFRIVNECEYICLKCYEEDLFKNGIDLDEVLRTETIPGMFFNTDDLKREGFEVFDDMDGVMVGSGRVGYSDPNNFFSRIKNKYDELKSKIVIFEYDSMSIGGLGGYVTVWAKDKKVFNN
jgi:hypothetical protein